MVTVRSFFNFVFLGLWTALMTAGAVTAGVVMRDPDLFKRAQRVWARGLLRVWGVELRVFGAESVDTTKSYVVMANHLSYVDIVVLFLALPIIPGFLAKRELARVPFLSQALRSGGHVLIDRGRRDSAVETIKNAAEQVRGGKTVLIFPEGTRGDSDTIGDLKKGGFHLAKSAQVPILPVGVRGSRSVFARGSLLIRPGTVEVHIGDAIGPELIEHEEHAALVSMVRGKLMELAAMPARQADRAEPAPA